MHKSIIKIETMNLRENKAGCRKGWKKERQEMIKLYFNFNKTVKRNERRKQSTKKSD